jgi:hypothetical protein
MRESVLFIGTQFSNLYTAVDTPARGRVNYCKKTGKWFQVHDESECWHKKKDEAEAALLAIKERRERAVKG